MLLVSYRRERPAGKGGSLTNGPAPHRLGPIGRLAPPPVPDQSSKRSSDALVQYAVVREHVERFLAEATRWREGQGVARFRRLGVLTRSLAVCRDPLPCGTLVVCRAGDDRRTLIRGTDTHRYARCAGLC